MTYLFPNQVLEEHPKAVISSDSLFSFVYSSKRKKNNMLIRNTTHVLIMLRKGTKRLSSNGVTVTLHAGDIFLLKQGNYLMSEVLGDEGVFETMMVYFDDGFIIKFIHKHTLDLTNLEEVPIVSFSSDTHMQSIINAYAPYVHQDVSYKNEIIKLKTEELFLYLLSHNKKSFLAFLKSIHSSSKERIRYILEANLDLIHSVADMSKIARVSKNELRDFMKNTFELAPKTWLDNKRLEQSALLLKTSEESISSIASTCGYASLSWFGVQFKKRYGCTAKEYREKVDII